MMFDSVVDVYPPVPKSTNKSQSQVCEEGSTHCKPHCKGHICQIPTTQGPSITTIFDPTCHSIVPGVNPPNGRAFIGTPVKLPVKTSENVNHKSLALQYLKNMREGIRGTARNKIEEQFLFVYCVL